MKLNKLFSLLIVIPLLGSAINGYYRDIGAMKNNGSVGSMRGALAYVEANWREGDVLYATDDGPWINLASYTDKPIYRMETCTVYGSLSPKTRDALGVQVVSLEELTYRRAWIFAPKYSPLHPACYTDAIASITQGEPVYTVDDGDLIMSGVWLVEK